MQQPAFPLTAEQVVRLIGEILSEVLDALRARDTPKVDRAGLTIRLGKAVGIDVPCRLDGPRGRVLVPYGEEISEPSNESVPLPASRGASDAV